MRKRWTMEDITKTGLSIGVVHLKQLEPEVIKQSKYKNKKTNGFDSKKEAEYFEMLKIREKAGLVTAIQCQVTFQLSVCRYIADFVFLNLETKQWEVVDVKGMKTAVYRMKNKMMLNELSIKICEV